MVYINRWSESGDKPFYLAESDSLPLPGDPVPRRREARINELIVRSIGDMISFQPERIIKACDTFRKIANYLFPWSIQSYSQAKSMIDVLRRVAIRPMSKYVRTMVDVLRDFSDDEWTIFIWKLKDMLDDTDWMEDVAIIQGAQGKVIQAWMEDMQVTEKTTDFSFLRDGLTPIYETGQDWTKFMREDILSIAKEPTNPLPFDAALKSAFPILFDVDPAWTMNLNTRAPYMPGIGGAVQLINYINWDKVAYRLVILKDTAATGVFEVDGAMARVGIPKALRTIIMAIGVGVAGAGIAWGGGATLAAAAEGAAIGVPTGTVLLSSRIGPFIFGAGAALQQATVRLTTSNLLTKTIRAAPLKQVTKAGLWFGGSLVFGQFILEEALQQWNFGLSKIETYDPDGAIEICDAVDATLDSRWKSWIPIYGPLWSLEKFFAAAKDYSKIMRSRAEYRKAQNKKKKKSVKDKNEP